MDTTQLFSLKGRSALITGGSRGIGRMIAEGFLAQGARVYISARKAAACDHTAKELSAFGTASRCRPTSRRSRARRRWSMPSEARGSLDILVNNAGAAWGAPFDEFPEKRLGQGGRPEPEDALLPDPGADSRCSRRRPRDSWPR